MGRNKHIVEGIGNFRELGRGKTPLLHLVSAKTVPMLRTLREHILLRKQDVIVLTKNLCLRM